MMPDYSDILAIVPGGSNTDLVISGARMVAPGKLSAGGRLTIGPGGKSRNVAQMMAAYLGPGRVAFLGRTLSAPQYPSPLTGEVPPSGGGGGAMREQPNQRAASSAGVTLTRPCGPPSPVKGGGLASSPDDLLPVVYSLLAQVPLAALRQAGVVTDFVRQVPYAGTAAGVAEILVSPEGENTIYLAPGVNAEFSPCDVDDAEPLFAAAKQRGGAVMPLALEIPLATAAHAARKARDCGMTVVLDPGGIDAEGDYGEVLSLVDIVKPNEHEVRLLTGVSVDDDASAAEAADVLAKEYGIGCTIITAGSRGAWHAAGGRATFYPACRVKHVADTTGCGDQFMAVLCSRLAREPGSPDAAMREAVMAAALQATRPGIQPVAAEEVRRFAAEQAGR
ncbi:MAG: bifunctional hydroxymethylpyrimidine kinase/phosphomethylpyrimidine kinase [Planctomycetes bacterium]|nr:bifunctional hydroxymethylpyrimidine kinase/phosphomethylpyrimidine kinase [Planctomycetota bacterium]